MRIAAALYLLRYLNFIATAMSVPSGLAASWRVHPAFSEDHAKCRGIRRDMEVFYCIWSFKDLLHWHSDEIGSCIVRSGRVACWTRWLQTAPEQLLTHKA